MTGKKITRAHHAFWGIVLAFGFVASAQAQNIGWEGETGIFVTPLAYTAKSPKSGFGRPLVGYHFLERGGAIAPSLC